MKRAFILSRPVDIKIAYACQSRMRALGWDAQIMVDPSEWDELPEDVITANYATQKTGMYGNACATGILEGIIDHSQPGDIVMKMDCDVWLSSSASDWFSSPEKARMMTVIYERKILWGGAWSARHEHVVEALRLSKEQARCSCAESYLNLKALKESRGFDIHPTEMFQQWVEGAELSYAATLPIMKRRGRFEAGIAMFQASGNTR